MHRLHSGVARFAVLAVLLVAAAAALTACSSNAPSAADNTTAPSTSTSASTDASSGSTTDSGASTTAPATAPQVDVPSAKPDTFKPVTKLEIKDVKEGTGAAVKTGDNVTAHYTGWLGDGKVFDSSVGKDPISFTVGAGQLIQGWEQGIPGMKVGGTRILTIPGDLGYGAAGSGATIPPNATLRFQITLVSINK